MQEITTTKPLITLRVTGQSSQSIWLDRKSLRLGREPDNDIVLQVPNISRYHAVIERRGDNWFYCDLNSQNGSFVNKQRIHEIVLHTETVIHLGKQAPVTITFRLIETTELDTPLPHRKVVFKKEVTTTGFVQVDSKHAVRQRPFILGRDSGADVHLNEPTVSRQHAMLSPAGSEWKLIDLNSANGTFVNGVRVRNTALLKPNDVINIGPFQLTYDGQGIINVFANQRGLRLDAHDLSIVVGRGKRRKRLLHEINISCYPEEFIGLVGGSGAGKSTLVKALSGQFFPEGKVLIEGTDLYRDYDAYRSQIGYVPQDDILHRDLTVHQALWYSARLRLPPDVSSNEIEQHIENVLKAVELSAQKEQPIHSLSGGERKRASIAVELLANPPLLFLDEPTSGLDPGLEKKMMVMLRKLADSGKTILLVTHATANITECNQVAFLSQGRLVYYGPTDQAGEFFKVDNENFSDIYNIISDPQPQQASKRAANWEERFKKSQFYQQYIRERFRTLPKKQGHAASSRKTGFEHTFIDAWRQFMLLTRRYFTLIWRDRLLSTILLAIMPLLAVLLLVMANHNWLVGDSPQVVEQQLAEAMDMGKESELYSMAGSGQGLLFMMTLASVLLGLFASAYEIVKESNVYARERMVFLQLIPYLASKIVLLGLFAALQIFLFLLVISLKVEFPVRGVFLPAPIEIYLTLLLSALAAILLGLLISALARNTNTVAYIIFGIMFVQILFAGVIFKFSGSAKIISTVTLSRWTMEALGASVNLDGLNGLTSTRFNPAARQEEISIDVEKPADDWEPVTITSEEQAFPGCQTLIPVPVVTQNEMYTVTETITRIVEVDPPPMDVSTPVKFGLNYERSFSHLIQVWGTLFLIAFVSGSATLLVLKKKDIV